MSVAMKLKQLGALEESQKMIVISEIKSITVEECYHKKNFLMSFFTNILRREESHLSKTENSDDTGCKKSSFR